MTSAQGRTVPSDRCLCHADRKALMRSSLRPGPRYAPPIVHEVLAAPGERLEGGGLTFLLNLHGGGSAGAWQREYFPAYQYVGADVVKPNRVKVWAERKDQPWWLWLRVYVVYR